MYGRYEVYDGMEPFIFVSYSHKDSEKVLPIIQELRKRGLRIWYDQGIEVGTEWPEYIAEQLLKCKCVLAFISPNFITSQNCKREINFAVDKRKEILCAYMEEVQLTPGMEMQLNSLQALFAYKHPDETSFIDTLSAAQLFSACREALVTNSTCIKEEIKALSSDWDKRVSAMAQEVVCQRWEFNNSLRNVDQTKNGGGDLVMAMVNGAISFCNQYASLLQEVENCKKYMVTVKNGNHSYEDYILWFTSFLESVSRYSDLSTIIDQFKQKIIEIQRKSSMDPSYRPGIQFDRFVKDGYEKILENMDQMTDYAMTLNSHFQPEEDEDITIFEEVAGDRFTKADIEKNEKNGMQSSFENNKIYEKEDIENEITGNSREHYLPLLKSGAELENAGKIAECLPYYVKAIEKMEALYEQCGGEDEPILLLTNCQRVGYFFAELKKNEEAVYYFEKGIKYGEALRCDASDAVLDMILPCLSSCYKCIIALKPRILFEDNKRIYMEKAIECDELRYARKKEEAVLRELYVKCKLYIDLLQAMNLNDEVKTYIDKKFKYGKELHERCYIYVSYDFDDTEEVMQTVKELRDNGYFVGANYGNQKVPATNCSMSWVFGNTELEQSRCAMVFITKKYLKRCINDFSMICKDKKKVILVYLEDVRMPRNIDVGGIVSIYKYKYNDERSFYNALFQLEKLSGCRI